MGGSICTAAGRGKVAYIWLVEEGRSNVCVTDVGVSVYMAAGGER